MNQQQFLEWKIKDLKKRLPKLLHETSKYAMRMTIQELEEVRNFGKAEDGGEQLNATESK